MKSSLRSRTALSILCVEDDKEALKVLSRMIALKFPDITIHVAENGKLALELFKEQRPEIVITDINMPVMDGIQMAREIKAIKTDTKFIVLTGYSDKNYLEQFCEIGYSDYIMKPIAFGILFAAIEKCIAEVKLQRQ